jgi:hypothetical protein
MDAGPRPTNAEMAQLVALLEEAGWWRFTSPTSTSSLVGQLPSG